MSGHLSLSGDALASCREQAERANRMDVCASCGLVFESGQAWAPATMHMPLPRFNDRQYGGREPENPRRSRRGVVKVSVEDHTGRVETTAGTDDDVLWPPETVETVLRVCASTALSAHASRSAGPGLH